MSLSASTRARPFADQNTPTKYYSPLHHVHLILSYHGARAARLSLRHKGGKNSQRVSVFAQGAVQAECMPPIAKMSVSAAQPMSSARAQAIANRGGKVPPQESVVRPKFKGGSFAGAAKACLSRNVPFAALGPRNCCLGHSKPPEYNNG